MPQVIGTGMGRHRKGSERVELPGMTCPGALTPYVVRAAVCACCLLVSLLVASLAAPGRGSMYAASALPGLVSPSIRAGAYLRPASATFKRLYAEGSPDCGLTMTIRVRMLDGAAAPGVTVRIEARPASSGGPETYRERADGCPADARPVLTGTLTARTDATGRARLDRLGRGIWIVWLEGEVGGLPISRREVQGLPPYGANPEGNGHLELLDLFNEEFGVRGGGAERGVSSVPTASVGHEGPVGPVQLASTSSYVLLPSDRSWVPALDMAEEGDPPSAISSFPVPSSTPPSPIQATQQAIETGGPSRDALLPGTPLVVGTVGTVKTAAGGVAFPQQGPTDVGSVRGRVWDKVLLLFSIVILGIGLLLWAAFYTRSGQEEQEDWTGHKVWRGRRQ